MDRRIALAAFVAALTGCGGGGSGPAIETQVSQAPEPGLTPAPTPRPPPAPTSVLLTRPAGFDWAAPVNVYRTDSGLTTDFDADSYYLAAGAELWVSPSGNDATGAGTQASPYRTMGKAFAEAALLGASTIDIYVVAGLYDRRHKWTNTAPTGKNFNVIAVGGEAIFSSRYEPLAWTLVAGATYSATRSAIDSIRDEKFANADGVAPKLTLAASQAACEATSGSYYISGSTVLVHRQDGSAPDSQLLVMSATTGSTAKQDQSYFVRGIVFEGGVSGAFYAPSTAGTTNRLVFDRCKHRYSGNNGLRISGTPLVISHRCEAYGNDQDGFNYHESATSGVSPKAVEIGCRGFGNGGDGNDNGSTVHEDCRIVRVNGEYFRNGGPNVVDVGTAQSWNLGCKSFESSAAAATVQNAAFATADTAKMYLDTCTGKAHYAAIAGPGSVIEHRGTSLTGLIAGPVTPL